jgi:hypothetical protein
MQDERQCEARAHLRLRRCAKAMFSILCRLEMDSSEVILGERRHSIAWWHQHVVEIDTQCKTLNAGEAEQLKLEREVGGRGHHGE